MQGIYMINYSVKGIKSLDELVTLSFYKKTINKDLDTKHYNIKGIYGINGSGKSGIIASVDILKNILTNTDYLNNPLVQKNLDAIINKKIEKLYIEASYIVNKGNKLMQFCYNLTLSKDISGKYIISGEKLSSKNATSRKNNFNIIYQVSDGQIVNVLQGKKSNEYKSFFDSTINLLSTASMSAIFYKKYFISRIKKENRLLIQNDIFYDLLLLVTFGKRMHVYMDQSDDHRGYFIFNSINNEDDPSKIDSLVDSLNMDTDNINVISYYKTYMPKHMYGDFVKTISKLCEFLQIFKADLKNINIDRREDKDRYICNLIMEYESYNIDAEFESTGIKKLIKLYAYLNEMSKGGIIFIDELDSNLHDVYLCALLEYLMEYGDGQLCFTTHNVGPMDILKRNRESIDFLSVDHKIYPWKNNGNYSPSKLYRNGMIEGSPFNIDSIDFIGVFDTKESD